MSRSAPCPERTPLGISLATGSALLVPLLFADHFVQASPWRFTVPVLAVAVFAAVTDDLAATAGFVLVAALLVDGFLLGGDGSLTWDGTPDAVRLLAFVTAAAVGLGVRSAADAVRGARADGAGVLRVPRARDGETVGSAPRAGAR